MAAFAVVGCPIEGNVHGDGKTTEIEGVMVGLVLNACLRFIGGLSDEGKCKKKPVEAGNGDWDDSSGTDVRACTKSKLGYSIEVMPA